MTGLTKRHARVVAGALLLWPLLVFARGDRPGQAAIASAHALATAAFVLGPARGIAFLERQGVDGLILSPSLVRTESAGFHHHFDTADATPR